MHWVIIERRTHLEGSITKGKHESHTRRNRSKIILFSTQASALHSHQSIYLLPRLPCIAIPPWSEHVIILLTPLAV